MPVRLEAAALDRQPAESAPPRRAFVLEAQQHPAAEIERHRQAAGPRFGAGTWLPFYVAGDLAQWASFRGALWSWRGSAARRP